MKPTPELEAFAQLAEAALRKAGYPQNLTAIPGKKYSKIVERRDGESRPSSVHSFIDLTTGDILKPASWERPAKGIRGNITNPDGGRSALYPDGHPYGGMIIALR